MSVVKENDRNVLKCDGTKCKEMNNKIQEIKGDGNDTQEKLEEYSNIYGWFKSGAGKHYCGMCRPK